MLFELYTFEKTIRCFGDHHCFEFNTLCTYKRGPHLCNEVKIKPYLALNTILLKHIRGVEVNLYAFVTSTLDGCKW